MPVATQPDSFSVNPGSTPESTFMSTAAASNILAISNKRVDYEDLVAYDLYPKEWDKELPSGEIPNQKHAREGLGQFLKTVANKWADEVGLKAPEKDLDYWSSLKTARRIVFKVFSNHGGTHGTKDGDLIPDAPYLAYQSTHRMNADPANDIQEARGGTFLHFGTITHQKLSNEFAAPVRLYCNPKIDETPKVTAMICEEFIKRTGYVPTGKFAEDATADKLEGRNDRLLFWAYSSAELYTLADIVGELGTKHPALFKNRDPLKLGIPLTRNGKEVPTVRIAQEPSDRMCRLAGRILSFTESRILPITAALKKTFPNANGHKQADGVSAHNFIYNLRTQAVREGLHPDSFAFNADQDMSVIYHALGQ